MVAQPGAQTVPVMAALTTVTWTTPEPPSGIPTAFVDVTGRPDLIDLGRVVATEVLGRARVVTQWHQDRQHGAEILDVAVQTPVRCHFAIAFDVAIYRPFLLALRRERRLCVAMTLPAQAAIGPLCGYLVLSFLRSEER